MLKLQYHLDDMSIAQTGADFSQLEVMGKI